MKRFKSLSWIFVPLAVGLLVTACATYYKVQDPGTGNTYYTDKVKREGSGAAMFKDARTNAEVTIQNSVIMEITKDEYKAGISTPAPIAAPAPAQTPAPAPEAAPAPAPTPAPAPAPEKSTAPEEPSK